MKKLSIDFKRKIISLTSSISLHLIVFVIILLAEANIDQSLTRYRQIIILESMNLDNQEKLFVNEKTENIEQKKILEKTESANIENTTDNDIITLKSDEILVDSLDLVQIYSEKTLNLSLKYPAGWVFIDQNKNNKLDGVTFWSAEGIYQPPPYIHLEVVDKDYFDERRFKFKVNQFNCIWYFNDPKKLENQITQEVYIRTEGDEDFKLKLIIRGEEQFKDFQPRFFAIIKSLKWESNRLLDF